MRFYENILFLLLYFPTKTDSNIVFTVEENGNSTISRHLHRLRHSRGSMPYLSASSTTINDANRVETFSLNCPHVADASNKNVRIEVIWTLNDTIWLKIDDGQQKIVNGESTFNKRRVAGKTVMRILLNNGRYLFDYDELTGDFCMEISPVSISMDSGAWQCHVTVRQTDGVSHTLTSRRRIRLNQELKKSEKVETSTANWVESREMENHSVEETAPIQKRGDRASPAYHQNFAAFSRQTDDMVYMTRKDELTSVIFARNDGPRADLKRRMEAQIDYELDMNDDGMAFAYPNFMNSRTRTRSAQHYLNSGVFVSISYFYMCLILVLFIF